MLDDDAVSRLGMAYLKQLGCDWALMPGIEISDPPGVYFAARPPIPHWVVSGAPQFVVLRTDGRIIPLGPTELMLALKHVMAKVGAHPQSDAQLQDAAAKYWPEVVQEVVRQELASASGSHYGD